MGFDNADDIGHRRSVLIGGAAEFHDDHREKSVLNDRYCGAVYQMRGEEAKPTN